MKLSIIAAVSENNVIGQNNQLPWHLPKDLKYFKSLTIGKPVVMGRKTYESLGKPLPGRLNIVLSGSAEFRPLAGVLVFNNFDEIIKKLQGDKTDEAFIIGGGRIFEISLPYIDCMYITRVHGRFESGDVFFPEIDHTHWKLVMEEKHEPDEKHLYAFTFQHYERIEM